MGFWRDKADSQGQDNAPKLISGNDQKLKIVKVVYGKGDNLFESNKGDKQIMVVFADNEGREGPEMFTLSDAAAWKLAKMLDAAGLDLDKMDQVGVTPAKFAEPKFADMNLIGRDLRANVIVDRSGWPNFEYLRREPVASGEGDQKLNPDDIPF